MTTPYEALMRAAAERMRTAGATQEPLVLPEGKMVWTDEFDPAGENLPESVIRVRRARRAFQAAKPEVPLGLDLSKPSLDPQDMRHEDGPAFPFPDNPDYLHSASLERAFRNRRRA
jgi:hypothetical protein